MRAVMRGDRALARGLVEGGLETAWASPGAACGAVLSGIMEQAGQEGKEICAEWSVNGRCAFEAAFGAAMAGKRTCCILDGAGFNVAFPALMRARAKPIEGALVVVVSDEPVPDPFRSNQDPRLPAIIFKIAIFDPACPSQACDLALHALRYSFEQKTMVMLRSSRRAGLAEEEITLFRPGTRQPLPAEEMGGYLPLSGGPAPALVREVLGRFVDDTSHGSGSSRPPAR